MSGIVKILTVILKILKKIVRLKKYIKFGNLWNEVTEETGINPFTDEKLKTNMENRKRNSRCRDRGTDKQKKSK